MTLKNVSADIVIAPIAQVKSSRIFFVIIVFCGGRLIIVGVRSRKSEHYFFFSDKWHIPQRVAEVEERHRLEEYMGPWSLVPLPLYHPDPQHVVDH